MPAEMKKKLVIVESPAKAKAISRYLGKGYKVEASQGHVCDLPKSQLGVDTDHDFDMKYITIRGRGEILSRIRKEAKRWHKIKVVKTDSLDRDIGIENAEMSILVENEYGFKGAKIDASKQKARSIGVLVSHF